jgi:hypothetical protein
VSLLPPAPLHSGWSALSLHSSLLALPKLSLLFALFLPCPLCASRALPSNSRALSLWPFLPSICPLHTPRPSHLGGITYSVPSAWKALPFSTWATPAIVQPQVCFVSLSLQLPTHGLHGAGRHAHLVPPISWLTSS